MKLSRDDFSRRCGVSKMATSKAIARGAVIEDDRGRVDCADPTNRAYMQADHAVMNRVKAEGRAPAGRGEKSKRRGQLQEAKLRAEIRLKEEQANYHVQRRARELGLLVELSMVQKRDAAFGAEFKLRFLGLPRQIAQELFDLAHSKGATPMAIEGLLLERITDGATHCKEKARETGLGTFGL